MMIVCYSLYIVVINIKILSIQLNYLRNLSNPIKAFDFIFKLAKLNLAIRATNKEPHHKIMNYFKGKNTVFHTFLPLGTLTYKIVLQNFHHSAMVVMTQFVQLSRNFKI